MRLNRSSDGRRNQQHRPRARREGAHQTDRQPSLPVRARPGEGPQGARRPAVGARRKARELAVGVGAAVVFPEYDRSPEARNPVAIEQSYAVAQWVIDNGAAKGLDASRLAVAGDSVGGNMTAALTLMAKERGGPALAAQVLFYPVTDARFDTPSYDQFAEGYYLRRDGMEWFWNQYTTENRSATSRLPHPFARQPSS